MSSGQPQRSPPPSEPPEVAADTDTLNSVYAARVAIWRQATQEADTRARDKLREQGEQLDAFRASLRGAAIATQAATRIDTAMAANRETAKVWQRLAASVFAGMDLNGSISYGPAASNPPRPMWRRLLARLTTPGVLMIAFLKRWYLLRLALKLIGLGQAYDAVNAVHQASAMLTAVKDSSATKSSPSRLHESP